MLTLSNKTYHFKLIAFCCFSFLLIFNGLSQDCKPTEYPFKAGEQIDYDVFYNMGKVWVPAGKVRFTVKDSIYNNKSCFLFDGKGKSLKSYDWFFKVRDHYASLVEKKTFQPQRFVRNVSEGDFKLYYDYRFNNQTEKATVYKDKIDRSKKSTINFPNCSYDVITSVYYARTLDYSNVKYNDTIQLSMMVDKEIYDNVYIRYLGTEIVEDQYGKKHECIKFSPQLIEGTLFQEGESMNIYVTNDKNRIPIYIEAEIVVGSVKAYIKSMKNLKYPA